MQRISPALLLWLAPTLSGQLPTDAPPAKLAGADLAAAAARAACPMVLYDQPGDGTLWAVGQTYKACFAATTFTYVPFLGSSAPRTYPVQFTLESAHTADRDLALVPGFPVRDGDRVTIARGALTEVYDLTTTGIEQSFRLDGRPGAGDLDLHIGVRTDLVAADTASGITFAGPLGSVNYEHAVAIDAAGVRAPLAIARRTAGVSIRVPQAFLRAAHYPVLVDPLVSTASLLHASNYDTAEYDVAYDASLDRHFVTWQLQFAADDYDVWLRRFDAQLQPVGVPVIVDTTTFKWSLPRIASHDGADTCLVVAQVDVAGQAWIAGRLYGATGNATSAQLVVDKEGSGQSAPGNKRFPAVGGDAASRAGGWFTVVWQCYETSSYDIHLRQVATDGSLRTAAPVRVATSLQNETYPAIAKCGGVGRPDEQAWLIAFQRSQGTEQTPDDNIWGAVLGADGLLRTFATGVTFPIDLAPAHHLRPAVSSPTHSGSGVTRSMVTYHDLRSSGDADVHAAVVAGDGSVVTRANLSALDSPLVQGRPQMEATVDTDGCRFAVAFTEQYSSTDFDTRMSLFAFEPLTQSLLVHEARIPLRTTVSRDRTPRVLALRSGGGTEQGPRYIAVHTTDHDSMSLHGELLRYDGVRPGGYASRPTGCHGLAIAGAGTPAIGHTAGFAFAGGSVGHGFLLGTPAATPLPCSGGCVLGTSMLVTVAGSSLQLAVPCDAHLAGASLAVQGFSVGSGGTCFGSLALSNTIDVTVQ